MGTKTQTFFALAWDCAYAKERYLFLIASKGLLLAKVAPQRTLFSVFR